jgi:hypothetical protein
MNHLALDSIGVETFEAISLSFSGALAPLPGFYLNPNAETYVLECLSSEHFMK